MREARRFFWLEKLGFLVDLFNIPEISTQIRKPTKY